MKVGRVLAVALWTALAHPSAHASPFLASVFIKTGGGDLCNVTAESASCSFIETLAGITLLSAAGEARGDSRGALHAFADTYAPAPVPGGIIQTSSVVQLVDWLHTSGRGRAVAEIEVSTDGYTIGNASGFTQFDAKGVTTTEIGECYFWGSGSCTVRFEFDLATGFTFKQFLGVSAAVEFRRGDPERATAWFADTSQISRLSFLDLAGIPITVPYTTDSGFRYPIPVIVIPEPSPLLCLLLAIIGLQALRMGRAGRNDEVGLDRVPYRSLLPP